MIYKDTYGLGLLTPAERLMYLLDYGDSNPDGVELGSVITATPTGSGVSDTLNNLIGSATQINEDNLTAFLLATTTEQVRMAAFLLEINNRTLT